MIKLAIICGGPGVEHEVSLQSAISIAQNLDYKKYTIFLVGLTKLGKFVHHPDLILDKTDPLAIKLNPEAIEINFRKGEIAGKPIDVIFSIIHGSYGEDGKLQGFLGVYQIPFIGSGMKSSAISMDKHFTKIILANYGIEVVPYLISYSWQTPIAFSELEKKLGTPLFIKPANSGSSVGVSRCNNHEEYEMALAEAFKHDHKILIEKSIDGREIEIGVLGNPPNLQISVAAEILSINNFYDYRSKYVDSTLAKTIVPTNLSSEQLVRLKEITKNIYSILECNDLARVDFFLEKTSNKFIFNEINTLPGFTRISMYPQMFAKSGINFTNLLDNLIQMAINKTRV